MQETVFLAVWLKRQEAQAYQARIFAQGFYDLAVGMQAKPNVHDAFKLFVEALFPFKNEAQEAKDAKMKEVLQRQTSKGILTFKPIVTDFLRNKSRVVNVPKDFAEKMAARRKGKS